MKLFATRLRLLTAAAAAIILLYSAIGFLLFPAILQKVAVQELTKFFGRTVTIRKIDFNPYAMSVTIRSFQLDEPKGGATLSLDSLYATFAPLSSLFHRTWMIKEAGLMGLHAHIVRNAGGSLNFADLLLLDWPKGTRVRIGHFHLLDGNVVFRDEAVPGGFSMTISRLTANVNDFSTTSGAYHESSFAVSAVSEAGETFSCNGSVRLQPIGSRGEIVAEKLLINRYTPYLAKLFNFTIADGTLTAHAAYDLDLARDHVTVLLHDGTITAHSLRAYEKAGTKPFFGFAELAVAGAQVDLLRKTIEVASIDITGGSAVLRRLSDNSFNFQHLKSPAQTPSAATTAPSVNWNAAVGEIRLADFAAEVNNIFGSETVIWKELRISKPAFRMNPPAASVAAVTLRDGRLIFTDPSLVPPVRMALTHLEISMGGFSSEIPALARVAVSAEIGDAAPLQISGESNPIRAQGETNFRGLLQNVSLVPLSPYTAKYLGYELAKGEISLDTRFLIEGRKLNALTQIVIDRLTLGGKTESKDATKLPVHLIIALLKDFDGKITLKVPIEIALDDPKFEPQKQIIEAVLSPFKKIATSPFAALGAQLGGGGQELGFQVFSSGSAELDPQETGKLDTILQGLKRWPEFTLNVEGSVDADKDTGDLQLLAANRARTVKEYFLRQGTLEPQRIFLVDNSLANVPRKGSRALLSLYDK